MQLSTGEFNGELGLGNGLLWKDSLCSKEVLPWALGLVHFYTWFLVGKLMSLLVKIGMLQSP